jgi:hypothetical protein
MAKKPVRLRLTVKQSIRMTSTPTADGIRHLPYPDLPDQYPSPRILASSRSPRCYHPIHRSKHRRLLARPLTVLSGNQPPDIPRQYQRRSPRTGRLLDSHGLLSCLHLPMDLLAPGTLPRPKEPSVNPGHATERSSHSRQAQYRQIDILERFKETWVLRLKISAPEGIW